MTVGKQEGKLNVFHLFGTFFKNQTAICVYTPGDTAVQEKWLHGSTEKNRDMAVQEKS